MKKEMFFEVKEIEEIKKADNITTNDEDWIDPDILLFGEDSSFEDEKSNGKQNDLEESDWIDPDILLFGEDLKSYLFNENMIRCFEKINERKIKEINRGFERMSSNS